MSEYAAKLEDGTVVLVEVVRCRDCVFFDDEGEFGQWCTQLDFGKKEIADGFCAWASRRES